MDDELQLFLERWISERQKLVKKYELKVEWWIQKYGEPALGSELRKIEHYKHELKMLEELKARSLSTE